MKLRKVIALLCAGALAMGTLVALAGCGQSAEDLIRESVAQEFDTYKNKDESVVANSAEQLSNMGLDELNIDTHELVLSILDGLDYSIDDVTVNGDKATVQLTITSKSYSDFEKAAQVVQEDLINDPALGSMAEDEILDAYSQKIIEAVRNIEPSTQQATVEYEKQGNMWEPVNGEHSLADIDSLVFAE